MLLSISRIAIEQKEDIMRASVQYVPNQLFYDSLTSKPTFQIGNGPPSLGGNRSL